MSITYIGLDFESSGTDPWGDSAPIQIGIALPESGYKSLIGGWDFKNEYVWSEEAGAVHGIGMAEVQAAPPVWQVDITAAASLLPNLRGQRMWNVIVGWNVAGFDRQFITRHFPNLNRILSYRTVDLNAIVFSLSQGQESEYNRIKKAAKQYAEDVLNEGRVLEAWHDAMYDARAALLSFEYLEGLTLSE